MKYRLIDNISQPLVPIISIILLLNSPLSIAALSMDVVDAMDEVNACQTIRLRHTYEQCMQQTNGKISAAIQRKSSQVLSKYPSSKKQKILDNIQSKINSNKLKCESEQPHFGDSPTGQRRLPYCIYENMLETLINVERNIKSFLK